MATEEKKPAEETAAPAADQPATSAPIKKKGLMLGSGIASLVALAWMLSIVAVPSQRKHAFHPLQGPFIADVPPSTGFQVNLSGNGGKHFLSLTLKVEVDALKLPIVLSPARMVSGNAHLTLFSAGMVETTWPEGSGQALFSSSMQGASFPGAQIAFPRTKKGKQYLVEFSVVLFGPQTFNFRVFDYPLGGYQDVALPGNRADILTVLVPPIDSISGALEFGAGIQQRDPASEAAGWALYSVRVSTTS